MTGKKIKIEYGVCDTVFFRFSSPTISHSFTNSTPTFFLLFVLSKYFYPLYGLLEM